MGWLEFQRSIDNWRDHLLVPQFLNRLEGWFFEAAGIMGSARSLRDPVRIKWTPPRREMISPKDEIGPLKEAVKAGFRTRSNCPRWHRPCWACNTIQTRQLFKRCRIRRQAERADDLHRRMMTASNQQSRRHNDES